MASGTRAPKWGDDEFDRLGQLILEYVSDGKTVMDACYAYQDETNGLRSVSSCRYKFATKIMPRIKDEYEVAKQLGAQKSIDERTQQREQSNPKRRVRRTMKKLNLDIDEPVDMTKKDLIKLIRNVTIYDENAIQNSRELEDVRAELEQVKKDYEDLQNKHTLLQRQNEELKQEHDTLLNAFNIARRAATNAPDPAEYVYARNKDGTIETVKK